MVQDSKGKTSALTHSKYTGNLPLRTFSQSQTEKLSQKPEEEFDRKALLAALNAYIAQKVAMKNSGGRSSVSRSKVTSPYTNRLKPLQSDHLDGTLAKEKTGDFEMKPSFPRRPGAGGLVPGSTQNDLRIPLTAVDGKRCF